MTVMLCWWSPIVRKNWFLASNIYLIIKGNQSGSQPMPRNQRLNIPGLKGLVALLNSFMRLHKKRENFFEEKIKEVAKEKIIFDIGGASRFQKALAIYEEYFADCDYKTIDIDESRNPDIIADAHNLPLADKSADAVICNSVLEHVPDPLKVVDEIYRILKPGGKCLIHVPFLHAYHGGKEYHEKDYWRFSRDGIQYLLRRFDTIEMQETRGHFQTITELLPYAHRFPINIVGILARFLDIIFSGKQSKNQVSGYNVFCIK